MFPIANGKYILHIWRKNPPTMRKFIIERNLPGAGNLTTEEIAAISLESVEAIRNLNITYVWFESFITENKIYCIHGAESAEDVWALAKCMNLPANSIEEIRIIFDPITGSNQ